jgi:hypothetical protein
MEMVRLKWMHQPPPLTAAVAQGVSRTFPVTFPNAPSAPSSQQCYHTSPAEMLEDGDFRLLFRLICLAGEGAIPRSVVILPKHIVHRRVWACRMRGVRMAASAEEKALVCRVISRFADLADDARSVGV